MPALRDIDVVVLDRQDRSIALGTTRLRVLSTELARVRSEGGDVVVRVGAHRLGGQRLSRLLGRV